MLGFVGVDGNGLAGLEKVYEEQLAGEAGSETIVRDPAGRTLRTVRAQGADLGRRPCA